MQLNITGHHLEITTPLKEYVENKFERLQRHFDQITTTHVILTVEKIEQKAEATIHIAGGDLFAHATSEDLAMTDRFVDQLAGTGYGRPHRGAEPFAEADADGVEVLRPAGGLDAGGNHRVKQPSSVEVK